jgi:hypothetical protein
LGEGLDLFERGLGKMIRSRRRETVRPAPSTTGPLLVEKTLELLAVVLAKLWIDLGFEGIKTEQGSGEAVDGADLSPFDMADGLKEAAIQFILRKLIAPDQRRDFGGGFLVSFSDGAAGKIRIEIALQPSRRA